MNPDVFENVISDSPADDSSSLEGVVSETRVTAPDPLRCAYTVGVTQQGRFIFETAGEGQGIVELLGLHNFAGNKLQQLHDVQLGTGSYLQAMYLQNIENLLGRLDAKLASLVKSNKL